MMQALDGKPACCSMCGTCGWSFCARCTASVEIEIEIQIEIPTDMHMEIDVEIDKRIEI